MAARVRQEDLDACALSDTAIVLPSSFVGCRIIVTARRMDGCLERAEVALRAQAAVSTGELCARACDATRHDAWARNAPPSGTSRCGHPAARSGKRQISGDCKIVGRRIAEQLLR
jgi:hypothetical protein